MQLLSLSELEKDLSFFSTTVSNFSSVSALFKQFEAVNFGYLKKKTHFSDLNSTSSKGKPLFLGGHLNKPSKVTFGKLTNGFLVILFEGCLLFEQIGLLSKDRLALLT